MDPKERFPSLYMLLSCAKERLNYSEKSLGMLYSKHVSNLSGDKYLSVLPKSFTDEEANNPTYRERKKQFQNESRIFFNRICTLFDVPDSLELKPLDRFHGNLHTIEGQIQRLIEVYPSVFDEKVGTAVLQGALVFQQKTKLTPLGYNNTVFREYNRIQEELAKAK